MIQSRFTIFCPLLVLFLSPFTKATCPSPASLPVKFNSTHYLGAYYYNKNSFDDSTTICNGNPRPLPNGYVNMAGEGQQFQSHALVVRPGCVVYEHKDRGNERVSMEYPAGVYRNIPEGTTNQTVRCNISKVDCQPRDEFVSVVVCDATQAHTSVVCPYDRVVGTAFSTALSDSMSLDPKLEEELKKTFWRLFSSTLRVSIMTQYNWANVPASVMEQPTTSQEQVTAAAGYIEKIYQVVGHCGESHVKTEFFKTQQEKGISTPTTPKPTTPKPQTSAASREDASALATKIAQLLPILWLAEALF